MNSYLHRIHIIHEFVYISVCQVDTWNDFIDEDGNKLNIGELKYQTKHGKFRPSYVHYVPARNVKSALALVVHLFLELQGHRKLQYGSRLCHTYTSDRRSESLSLNIDQILCVCVCVCV
jgi:hypothetical protein